MTKTKANPDISEAGTNKCLRNLQETRLWDNAAGNITYFTPLAIKFWFYVPRILDILTNLSINEMEVNGMMLIVPKE